HRTDMRAADSLNTAPYGSGEKKSSVRAWELALRHEITTNWGVYGRLGQSFRVATVDENYAQFGGPPPLVRSLVALLEPQTSRDTELGAEFRRGSYHARASVYRMKLENEIYFFAPTFSNINLPPTERRGVELAGDAQVLPQLGVNGSFTA